MVHLYQVSESWPMGLLFARLYNDTDGVIVLWHYPRYKCCIFFISPRKYMLWLLIGSPQRGTSNEQGPVAQSVVSLTSSLRASSLTILADSIYNFLKFFAEKM